MIGKVSGKGLRNEHTIGWEFREQLAFEGFEVYEQQDNGDYFPPCRIWLAGPISDDCRRAHLAKKILNIDSSILSKQLMFCSKVLLSLSDQVPARSSRS